jgi:hypothetical protein
MDDIKVAALDIGLPSALPYTLNPGTFTYFTINLDGPVVRHASPYNLRELDQTAVDALVGSMVTSDERHSFPIYVCVSKAHVQNVSSAAQSAFEAPLLELTAEGQALAEGAIWSLAGQHRVAAAFGLADKLRKMLEVQEGVVAALELGDSDAGVVEEARDMHAKLNSRLQRALGWPALVFDKGMRSILVELECRRLTASTIRSHRCGPSHCAVGSDALFPHQQ